MSNNPPALTPLQKATICVNEADDGTSNLSDMLVACQFILGCYNSKQDQSTRLKDKLLTKFTPAQQITEPPKHKITFGNQKGLDISTVRRLQPNASTKRVTPGINWNKYQAPPPVFQPKPVQRPPTTTPAPTTNNFTNKNVNYNTTSTNTNNLNNNKPQFSKPIIPQNDHIPTKTEKPAKRKFDDDDEEEEEVPKEDQFTTAKEKYISDCANKGIKPKSNNTKKTLGGRRKFNVPLKKDERKEEEPQNTTPPAGPTKKVSSNAIAKPQTQPSNNNNEENPNGIDNVNGVPLDDERLRNIEPRMLEIICREILDHSPKVDWDDIAGLKFAKKVVWEMVVWPAQNSQLFTGLRTPPKGLLLFGPPGTGKTLIGKAIASSSGATFFSITASSLTSKWIGEGEKMVRALFAVARCYQPAVVFIDEIDSLLTQRSESEHEASRRIKNEFLTQLDGAGTNKEDRLLLVGATNRPQELDEAARRRLVKKVYIPLPDMEARMELIRNLLKKQSNSLSDAEIEKVSTQTAGYSGSDLHALCSEAALGPLRALRGQDLREISADKVRPVNINDFQKAKRQVRASVGETELHVYEDWNKMYGSVEQFRMEEEEEDEDDIMDEIT